MNSLELLAQGVISQNPILLQGLGIYALIHYTKTIRLAGKAGVSLLATLFTSTIALWAVEAIVPVSFGMQFPVIVLVALLSGIIWQGLLSAEQDRNFKSIINPACFNSAVVGVLFTLMQEQVLGGKLVTAGLAYGIGYMLVLLVMAGIRSHLELAPIAKPLRGVPILLIAAGLLGLGLLGFRF